jgi:hypothetical protein
VLSSEVEEILKLFVGSYDSSAEFRIFFEDKCDVLVKFFEVFRIHSLAVRRVAD